MAREMQRDLLERVHATKLRATEQPQELAALDARIARLRLRLTEGDPDMTPDELQVAIERAEIKRRELAEVRLLDAREGARLLTVLPNAAELYRRQITLGLDGANPQVVAKARMTLRELLGKIRLEPEGNDSLWAAYSVQPAVLVRTAVSGYAG